MSTKLGVLSVWTALLAAITSYLLGSVSSAVIISKLFYKDDVRNYASGNAGATNVSRTFGLKPGIATLLFDFLKTAIAMLLGEWIAGQWGEYIAFVGCFTGHCWPAFFSFRGGKGVSICFCAALMFDVRLFAIIAIAFFLMAFITKIVSISSMTAMLVLIPACLFLGYGHGPILYGSIFAAIAVIYAHRSNIRRLINGTEPKFSFKKKS